MQCVVIISFNIKKKIKRANRTVLVVSLTIKMSNILKMRYMQMKFNIILIEQYQSTMKYSN